MMFDLDEREDEGQVGVDAVLRLQDLGGLDALPSRGNLDEDALLGYTDFLVELDDVKGLVDGSLCVEGGAWVNFGRDLPGDDLQNLLAELYQEVVQCSVNLLINVFSVPFAVIDGSIDQLSVFRLVGGGEDQRRVGGRKVTRVADDCGARSLQLIERGRHNVTCSSRFGESYFLPMGGGEDPMLVGVVVLALSANDRAGAGWPCGRTQVAA